LASSGLAAKPGASIKTFDNVDVYPLVMRLLGLAPLPNDGSIAPFGPALQKR
jgi:hypothetical protein